MYRTTQPMFLCFQQPRGLKEWSNAYCAYCASRRWHWNNAPAPSHPEQLKSFCDRDQCWSVKNEQCSQLLDEQSTSAAAKRIQPTPSPSRRMGAKHPVAGPTNYDHEAWSDWLGFCGQLGKPIFPSAASNSDEAATRAQILVFVAYSTAQLSATADVALVKVQAVGRQLELRDHPNHCFDLGS